MNGRWGGMCGCNRGGRTAIEHFVVMLAVQDALVQAFGRFTVHDTAPACRDTTMQYAIHRRPLDLLHIAMDVKRGQRGFGSGMRLGCR